MKKTVVITGATDGIGKALAILLGKEYNLALCGRNDEKMKDLIQQLGDCNVYSECFDITDDEKRKTFCRNVKEKFDTVDVLVNNAGANTKKDKVVDINLEDLRYMFELNCVSAVGMIQEFYPLMAEKQQGLFVNILSTCCLFNNPMAGSYSAAKDAMEGISKILLKEVKADNIGVCNVYPGGVDTNFRAVANHNYLKPETVAKMIKACMENEEGCVHDIVIRPFIEDNMA
ncbi:MAG: SDR family NAD(P)-dependent oxidoreductase [Lachnospiraceae bacterium]|nr:SDR family NAD(P)-dependent oxidoreductase [Lachnospiraceae bacterium]